MKHITIPSVNPLTIAVLFGGGSDEREISLESGRNVVQRLQAMGHTVLPIFVTPAYQYYEITQALLVSPTTATISAQLVDAQQYTLEALCARVDFVFLALHGGAGEDGTLQGALELLGMPYNGSGVLASAMGMDKHLTATLLQTHHIAVPQECLIDLTHAPAQLDTLMPSGTSFPLIVKPHNNGCSVGVMLVHTPEELSRAVAQLATGPYTHALVQEYIQGMELTVGVVGNRDIVVLPASAAVRTSAVLSIEEKFLPGAGENQTPAPLPEHVAQMVEDTVANTYRALGCTGYARIDCFWQSPAQSPTGTDRIVLLEVNTLPGLTPATCLFHQAAECDITPGQLLNLFVALGLQAHGRMPHTPLQAPIALTTTPEKRSHV